MMRESDKLANVRIQMEEKGLDTDEIEKMQFERPIDKEKDILIDFERKCCRYVRFDGRPQDDDIEFNHNVCVLLPS